MKKSLLFACIGLALCQLSYGQEIEQETKVLQGKTKVRTKNSFKFDLGKLYIGVFPDANVIIEPLSKDWGNKKTGIGFLQSFGGNLEVGYKLSEKNIPFISIGIENWKVNRRFIADKNVIRESKTALNTLPIRVGFKHYLSSKMYVSPSVGIQKLKLSNRNQTNDLLLQAANNKIGVGTKIGFTKPIKSFKLDYGFQYNVILTDQILTYKKPLHYAGLMVGVSL